MSEKFKNFQLNDFKTPISFWFFWNLGLQFINRLAPSWLPYKPSFPYYDSLLPSFHWPQWLYSWANFDGVHYLTIAEKGYLGTGLIQAFFPVFPLLARLISQLAQLDLMITGLLLNQILSLFLTCLIWIWLKTTFTTAQAKQGLLWWLLFPASFFLISFYNESLFVALALGSWLLAKQQKWWWAGILAAVATATRVVGIWLLPLLFLELLEQTWPRTQKNFFQQAKSWLTKNFLAISSISLSAVGLLSYMAYLHFTFHDPLYFLHQQSEFGAGRQESLVLWPQVVWRALKILLYSRPFDWKYFTYLQEFLVGTGSVILTLWGFWQRKKTQLTLPLTIYTLGCLLTPALTGTFSSMSRYALSAWPLWLVLVTIGQKNRLLAGLALAISLGLLIINTSLFLQGYWVA